MKDVQINGLTVVRHLRGEIYEVRATGARAAYRVLFATEGAKSQVLLAVSAFTKTTQKTPLREIRLAERRLADWRRRGRRRR
jgi:phage-related protein